MANLSSSSNTTLQRCSSKGIETKGMYNVQFGQILLQEPTSKIEYTSQSMEYQDDFEMNSHVGTRELGGTS